MKTFLHYLFLILFIGTIITELVNMVHYNISTKSMPSPIYLWHHDKPMLLYLLLFIVFAIGFGSTF